MLSIERVTLFGDIVGIDAGDMRTFVGTTRHLCGGSYPSRVAGLSDEEIERKTRQLLSEVGIAGVFPVTLCSSPEERATKILEDLSLRRAQAPRGLYWIIDGNPSVLTQVVRSIAGSGNHRLDISDILRSMTIVSLKLEGFFDCRDSTGIRIAILPPTPYPVHPTPAY